MSAMLRQIIRPLPSRTISRVSTRSLSSSSTLFADTTSKTSDSKSKNYNASVDKGHPGSPTSKHVTNSRDELDIQSSASAQGQRAHQSGDERDSSATSQKDPGNSNKKAEQNSKAPGVVIGMQDERGGKGDIP